jgi:hypothetical protein
MEATLATHFGLRFLDQPLESYISACKFCLTLALLGGVGLILARAYYTPITASSCSSCRCHCGYEVCDGQTLLKDELAADRMFSTADLLPGQNRIAAAKQPDNTSTRSSKIDPYVAWRLPPVGAVSESGLAQRRRTSRTKLDATEARSKREE